MPHLRSIFTVGILVSLWLLGARQTQATQYSTPGIRGTAHDFAYQFGCYDSTLGAIRPNCTPWRNALGEVEDEICIYCHTPHHANPDPGGAPLWNRALTNTFYDTYVSPTGTMQATVGQPNGISKLCLSCHDGTTAIDAYGNNLPGAAHTLHDLSPESGIHFSDTGANLDTNLANDHPISFVYDSSLSVADTGLFDPIIKFSGIGDVPANPGLDPSITVVSIPGSGSTNTIAADMLDVNSQVQCTSCHDVHNKYGWDALLVKNNTGSNLCLTCHNK